MMGHVAWRLTRRAFVNLWRAPLPSLVAVLTIGLALFLGAAFLAGLAGARMLLRSWGAEASITLYLARETTDVQARTLAEQLRREHPELEVVYVDRGEALARLRADLGELASTLDGLTHNPLPPTLEIRARGQLVPAELRALARALGGLEGVDDVDYGREWLDRIEALGRALRAAGAGALALVLGAAILVVANTIRLAVYARRDEIEIMKLVGATDGYVRLPFLIEGALQGVMGALLAGGGLWSVERWLLPRATAAFSFAVGAGLGHLQLVHGAILVTFGGVVGFVGSYLAVSRFLRT